MAENTNILEINGLHKNFFIRGQKFEVLAGVDLTVKKGELLAIVGASGCGKSTLLKLITTLETISSGEILLDGEPVNGPSPKCSMIFQEARLFPWLTVEQNIEFVISDTVPRAEKKKMVDYYIKLVGLTEFGDRLAKQYSLGMKQRLGLAGALLGRPPILILDEPTNGLDPSGIHEIRNLVKSLPNLYDCTVLISSHMLSEIELIADDIGILNHGRLLFEGSMNDLRQYALQSGFAADNLEDVFLSMVEKDNMDRKQRAKL